jgi:hypothetical protein
MIPRSGWAVASRALFALAALQLAGCAGSETVTLGSKAKDFQCAPDEKTADAIEQAMRLSDEDDYENAVRFAVPVPAGTQVRVEQHDDGAQPAVRVVVLDGEYKDRECWYAANVPGLLGEK